MALCSVEKLQEYTGVYPNDDDTMQALYVNSAIEIVKNYLGYNPEQTTIEKYYNGTGDNVLYLGARPIQSIIELSINGQPQTLTDFDFDDESLFFINSLSKFPNTKKSIKVKYSAGYLPNSPELNLIQMTCLKIAALHQEEGQNNIGITSKSWDGEGSRTFVSYENYDKYLRPISAYRVVR